MNYALCIIKKSPQSFAKPKKIINFVPNYDIIKKQKKKGKIITLKQLTNNNIHL